MRKSKRQTEDDKGTLLMIAIFALIGLLMLSGALYFTKDTIAFLPKAISATGKVIELKKENDSSSGRKGTHYHQIIEFNTKDNLDSTTKCNSYLGI